jgi:molecular chaperone DnaK
VMPGYDVGVDVGTTFTAAAVWREGRARVVPLGTGAAEVPSVVYLTPGGEWLVGDLAEQRGVFDPDRLGREFKRRMGDQTPILLGGMPQSAAALTGRLLACVLGRVAVAQGGPPDHLILTCPATWGGYKRDVLREAIDIADAEAAAGTWPPGEVTVVSEPLATATHFAASARVEPDEVVAVYDLGGGTFDAAVMAQTGDGHRLLGDAIGLEHLGGIDFDDAVLGHVTAQVADQMAELDPGDPATVAALAALRRACVEAKVTLSAETDASVPVVLPHFRIDVRLTRAEFESLIRPTLATTLAALRRALRTAAIDAGELASIVLAGGSSRIPLVAQMLTDELGRPITSDAHPKHPVALGAARLGPRPAETPAAAPTPGTDVSAAPVAAEPRPVRPPAAPVATAWRRARRLALLGLVAVTLAALGWLGVALTDGDGRGGAPQAAPTANERPEAGDDYREDASGEEPLSRSGQSGSRAGEDGGPTRGTGSGSPTSSPDRPGTAPGDGGGSSSPAAPGSPTTPTPRSPTSPGTTTPPGPSGRPFYDVNVGACVNDLSPHPPSNITAVEAVGCDTPHRFEVMGARNRPDGDYPGPDALSREIAEYCGALLEYYYDFRPELFLGGWVGYPTQQEWDRGVRRLTCFLGPGAPNTSTTFTGRIVP